MTRSKNPAYDESEAKLGNDPEVKNVSPQYRILKDVSWQSFESLKDNHQVSKIIDIFALSIANNISE